MLENTLSRRRIYAPMLSKSLCNNRLGYSLSQRLISALNLPHDDYACYFKLAKWQGESEEPMIICDQTIKDWGYERGDFYQTLTALGKARPELCGESLIEFWHDPVTNGWNVRVKSISKIMDKMAKELDDGKGKIS